MTIFQQKDRIAFTKTCAGIFGNLAAGWFGLVFIAPNFLPIRGYNEIFLLTGNLLWGILSLWISYRLERKLL